MAKVFIGVGNGLSDPGADAGRNEIDKIKWRIFFLERYFATEEKAEEEMQTGNL